MWAEVSWPVRVALHGLASPGQGGESFPNLRGNAGGRACGEAGMASGETATKVVSTGLAHAAVEMSREWRESASKVLSTSLDCRSWVRSSEIP